MKVTIKVNDGDQHTLSPQTDIKALASAGASNVHSDGGAPSINDTGGSTSGGADQVNIGGPPQWLKDSITKSKGEGRTASAMAADPASSDGGVAPTF